MVRKRPDHNPLDSLTLVVNVDSEADLAGVDVETNAILSLHTTEVGVVTSATGVDGGALVDTADSETGDVELLTGGDEARSVSSGPAMVAGAAEVELEPSAGPEIIIGGGNFAGSASAATLGVLVEGNVLGALGRDGEAEGSPLLEETVDLAQRTDLVPADTGLLGVMGVLEGCDVVVLGSDVGVNGHHVAAVVALDAGVTGGGNILESGTLGLLATTERLVARAGTVLLALVGLTRRRRGGRGTGGGLSLGDSGSLVLGSSRLRSNGGSGGSSGLDNLGSVLGDGDGLVGNDEIALGVSTLMSVAAGVGRDTKGGSQDDGGGRELHFDC
ncbi:hypothetical protein HG530_000732 [Fusarium avenaceum]|nr:hypothetical protein HG530_000732 [Fusarium avenaceum]